MTKVSKHFSLEEFARPARRRGGVMYPAAPYPAEWVDSRLVILCGVLETIREALGRPIRIGSGYRDPAYNRAIGGARQSQHMAGRAADIVVPGVSQPKVLACILELYQAGRLPTLGGLGDYPGRFCHVDVRPSAKLVRWQGSRKDN